VDPSLTQSLTPDAGAAKDASASVYLVAALSCAAPLTRPARICLDEVDVLEIGRGATRAVTARAGDGRRTLRLDLPDSWTSSQHCRLVRLGAMWMLEDAGSKNGTQVRGVPRSRAQLADGDVIAAGGSFLVFRRSAAGGLPDVDLGLAPRPAGFATMSPELTALLAPLERVARAPLTILLRGPTGCGKEVLARAIHAGSGRGGAFVAVNCGALAPTLLESELFGVKKGAFSGAGEDRPGLVRASDGGTLFLDEIGELPLTAQVTLLRVLQEGEVLPVGGHRAVSVDLRVVAASHRDLPAMVARGEFREDLYARLRGFELDLPPLAARREDLGLLVAELLPTLAGDRAARLRIRPTAAQALFDHRWPLNVRELVQTLGAALAVADGDELALEHLPASLRVKSAGDHPGGTLVGAMADAAVRGGGSGGGTWPPPAGAEGAAPDGGPTTTPPEGGAAPTVSIDRNDPEQVRALFAAHGGNVSALARALGTSRSQVRRLARRFSIALDDLRGDED
jgi:DNA-binding NtrC family response regulator